MIDNLKKNKLYVTYKKRSIFPNYIKGLTLILATGDEFYILN